MFELESEIASEAMSNGSNPLGKGMPLGPPKQVFDRSGGAEAVPVVAGTRTLNVPSGIESVLDTVTALTEYTPGWSPVVRTSSDPWSVPLTLTACSTAVAEVLVPEAAVNDTAVVSVSTLCPRSPKVHGGGGTSPEPEPDTTGSPEPLRFGGGGGGLPEPEPETTGSPEPLKFGGGGGGLPEPEPEPFEPLTSGGGGGGLPEPETTAPPEPLRSGGGGGGLPEPEPEPEPLRFGGGGGGFPEPDPEPEAEPEPEPPEPLTSGGGGGGLPEPEPPEPEPVDPPESLTLGGGGGRSPEPDPLPEPESLGGGGVPPWPLA